MFTFNLLNDLASLPDHFSASLLMRHSNRFPILDPAMAFEVGLTELGFERAEEFGQELARITRKPGHLQSTSVERCVDTANSIALGAGWDLKAVHNEYISYPYIEKIWGSFLDNNPEQVNGYPGEIKQILTTLLSHQNHTSSLNIFVTHDSVIACVIGYLIGEKLSPETWVDFLEGLVVWKENRHAVISWRGKRYQISLQ